MFSLEMILKTWSKTDIPLNPIMKVDKRMLEVGIWEYIIEVDFTPFVISSNPIIKLNEISSEIPNFDNIKAKEAINPEFSKIEIITEKRTTNPPIVRIADIDFFILSPKISPSSETRISLLLELVSLENSTLNSFLFQYLNIYPTVKADNIWDINRITPILLSLNKAIPTVPNINKGPELLVKAISLSASVFEIIFFSFKLHTTLAPTGYPLIIPRIIAIALSPGTLKTGLIILFRNLPKIYIKLVLQSSSVATKNGNNAGRTEVAHKASPFCAAIKFEDENKSKLIVKSINKAVIKYFFKLITIKFIMPPGYSYTIYIWMKN